MIICFLKINIHTIFFKMKKQTSPFLNLVYDRLRRLDYSLRTEQSYLNWIKRYIKINMSV